MLILVGISGDQVLVSGTKPGRILFLGETQFAPGQWAGVVLDEPVGKNDGSVAGVRYFQVLLFVANCALSYSWWHSDKSNFVVGLD